MVQFVRYGRELEKYEQSTEAPVRELAVARWLIVFTFVYLLQPKVTTQDTATWAFSANMHFCFEFWLLSSNCTVDNTVVEALCVRVKADTRQSRWAWPLVYDYHPLCNHARSVLKSVKTIGIFFRYSLQTDGLQKWSLNYFGKSVLKWRMRDQPVFSIFCPIIWCRMRHFVSSVNCRSLHSKTVC